MNFGHAFSPHGANPNISMTADDFLGTRRLQRELQQQNIALQQQNEQLSRRCGALENELRAQSHRCGALGDELRAQSHRCGNLEIQLGAQMQARQKSESQLFQVDRRRQAHENEIVALREQLHQERLRADSMCRAGEPVRNPASIPVRIVPVGGRRADEAEARELGLNDSANSSNPSEPSPGPVPPLSQYPDQIPEEDRKAMRTRMLKGRGPNAPPAPDAPAVDTPASAALLHDVESAPRAPSPGAHVSGSSHDDAITHHEARAYDLGQETETGAVDVDSEETEDEISHNEADMSQLGPEEEAGTADVDDEETKDGLAQNVACTSQLAQEGETGAPDVDSEETEDDCAADDMMISDDDDDSDDDSGAHDTTAPASSITLGYPGQQELCDDVNATESVSLAPSTATEHLVTNSMEAEDVVANNGLAPVKSETSAVPCTTFGSPAPTSSTAADVHVASTSTAVEEDAEKPAGVRVPSEAVFSATPVKAETFSSYTRAAVSREAPVATTCSTSPTPVTFSHQLFSSLTTAKCSTSDFTDTIAHPDSFDDRETFAGDRRREGTENDSREATPERDRRAHNTFCSSCKSFRVQEKPIAECQACPRMLCRTCAGRNGVKVPRGVEDDDVVFSPDKCLCQKRDSEFTKPPGSVDPQAHLLKQLKKHDLAHLFLDPVNVEENPDYLSYVSREGMIDLGTMTTKMKKRKQYQSSRGKLMFRNDLKRMWKNCWDFAGHKPECPTERTPGIVRCTIILEAMVSKYYDAYMEGTKELVTDESSWLAEQERRHQEKFDMCARSGGGMQDERKPTVAVAELEADVEDGIDLDEENRRIGATVARKRKFVFRDDDDDGCDDEPITKGPAGKEGLDSNICTLAAIGQQLKYSSGKT